eukprot:1281487-Prymnesium_polylepis.1
MVLDPVAGTAVRKSMPNAVCRHTASEAWRAVSAAAGSGQTPLVGAPLCRAKGVSCGAGAPAHASITRLLSCGPNASNA